MCLIDLIDGLCGKLWSEIFSCMRIKSVAAVDRIVINHVDVSSCGIHYGDFLSLTLT